MSVSHINTTELRKCFKCSEIKTLNSSNFHRNKNRPLGFEYKCKVCAKNRNDRRVKRYGSLSKEQKERHYQLGVNYRGTPKGKAIGLVNAYLKEDKRKGRECTLTQADVLNVYDRECIYCGFPATGFDRKDNSIGHTKDNCVPCCKECNVARMDNFTHEETFILGKTIRKIKLLRNKVF